MVRLLLRAWLAHPRRFVLILGSLLLVGGSQAALLTVIGPLFKVIFAASSDVVSIEDLPGVGAIRKALPGAYAMLEARVIDVEFFAQWIALSILVLGMVRSLGNYLYYLNQQAIVLYAAADLRSRLFEALLKRTYEEIARESPGAWMSRIMNDILWLQQRFVDITTAFLKDGLVVLSCIIALAVMHPRSALLLLVVAPVIALGMGRVGRGIAVLVDRFQGVASDLAGWVMGLRSRREFVAAECGASAELRAFDNIQDRYWQLVRRSIPLRAAFAPAMEIVGVLAFVAFLVFGTQGADGRAAPGEELSALLLAVGLIVRPLRNFGEQTARLAEVRGALGRTMDLLVGSSRAPARIVTASDLHSTSASSGRSVAIWTIRHLQARYSISPETGSGGVSLNIHDLEVAPRSFVAIKGASGSGKSLLLRVLGGLIEPVQWEASVSWQEFCHSTSYLGQAPFLFADTLRKNLLYGCNTGSVSESRVWECLAVLGLEEDVRNLPAGLDTPIDPLKRVLSGGQLQRLALARTVLRPGRRILLLDEVTSALDRDLERRVIAYLRGLAVDDGRTVLWVTHRFEELEETDVIWQLADGCLTRARALR